MAQAPHDDRHRATHVSTHGDTTHDLPHEGPIKTPKQLAVAVFFAFVVPIVAIVLLVTYVAVDENRNSRPVDPLK